MKILIVINPVSGDIDKDAFIIEGSSLLDQYGYDFTFFKTTGSNDLEKLKEEIEDYSPTRILAAGGDGTLLLTAKAVLGKDIPVGIIPLGSSNGMAMELGVDENPLEALKEALLSEDIRGLDMIRVNEDFCIHIGDLGINAKIVKAYSEDEKRGKITYAKYFLQEMVNAEPITVKLNINGETISKEVVMLAICNARKFGTGIPLNMEGNPFDGKFELVLINELNARKLFNSGLSFWDDNTPDNNPPIQTVSSKEAQITLSSPELLQLDGEVIGETDKVKIRIEDSAIQFISTGNNPYKS